MAKENELFERRVANLIKAHKKSGETEDPTSRALVSLATHAKSLRSTTSALDFLEGSDGTFYGGLGKLVVRMIPEDWRRGLEQSRMDKLRADFRELLPALNRDMSEIMQAGRQTIDFHNVLEELFKKVEEDPDNQELIDELRELLRAGVELDLNYTRDPEVEGLAEEIIESSGPEFEKRRRAEVVELARYRLALTVPVVETLKARFIEAVIVRDKLEGFYGIVLEISPAIDAIRRTDANLVRAAQLGITSFNTIRGELALSQKVEEALLLSLRVYEQMHEEIAKLEALGRDTRETLRQLGVATETQPKALTPG